LPEHQYVNLDTTLPFTFLYSRFASCSFTSKENFQYWIDLDYPSLHATLKMSYRPIKHDLRELAMDEEKRLSFHIQQGKADDVIFDYVNDPQNEVYGRIYQLTGKDVATPLQFWVSDSITHFLRASLYFNFTPNNDSLQPVIDYLHEDILQIVNTLKWKE
jgi:gliding motility-associated lipoprotein GldD